MRVIPKTEEQIALMRYAGKILRKAQEAMKAQIKAGVTLLELDKIAEDVILSEGAIPAFKNFPGEKSPFPGSICAMLNSEVVHGIPDDRALQDGDLLSVDCGVIWKGWHADAAFSLVVGGGDTHPEREAFQKCVYEALQAGCEKAIAGNRTGDIGHAIETVIKKGGYSICREYTGHGLGENLHEDPNIFNYGNPKTGMVLQEGMTIAIEPIIAMGNPQNKTLKDGWTVVTTDGKDACQWEHFGVVRKDHFEILA